jgi:GT2 family glycosyltransferase
VLLPEVLGVSTRVSLEVLHQWTERKKMNESGSVLLVCRNSLAYTKACVDSILKQSEPVNLLVIDNASTDGTSLWLRSSAVDISTVSVPFPLSVSQAWNLGLEWFWNAGAQEVLVLNNDVEIRPTMYSELRNYLRKHGHGVVTGGGADTRELYNQPFPEEWTEINHPHFSAFMIAKWAWEKVGGFDEGCVGAFYEDNIFHVEAHRKGVSCVRIELPFLHHISQTIKNSEPAEVRRIQQNADHNKKYFFDKYGCLPGTPEYDALFSPSTFGVE